MLIKFFSRYSKAPPQSLVPIVSSKDIVTSSINPTYTDVIFGDYDPKLIPSLTQEHKGAIKLCKTITQAAKRNDWHQVHIELVKLMELTVAHQKVEFTYLYARLEYTYKTRSEEHNMINLIRKEMKKISVSFLEFAEHNMDIAHNPKKQQSFHRELAQQQYALKAKMTLEENSLYPIYDLLYKKH